ncbi:MAG: insulinase family protein [Gammaproteobacteria bacterium]|nr:insulinase family protein [Gammaproteobacteria bacterium]
MAGTPAFQLLRKIPVSALNLEVQEYRHTRTGARHLHLAADDDNNAFLVAFLTVPSDSTGVAHILEHTALCGSRRYPVRDPFFMMTRRSLNTFMNAFTASDWTAYPFASRNRKDYFNLLDVYLDAAFFPTLDELDFSQEGHRVEFAEAGNPESELVYKGVVFNEMKGAMSSPVSTLWQQFTENLYPSITYHHNSGGDPRVIPDLSWQQLKQFHARHYHPSNALFMTYGDIPAAEVQERFSQQVLGDFKAIDLDFAVPDEQRFTTPKTVESVYALGHDEDPKQKTHIVVGWLLGRNTDQHSVFEAALLSGALLDNSASPLRLALETSDLGTAPSPLCGLEDSLREMAFACGLEGSEPDRGEAVEALILETLQQVAENGIAQDDLESVLHQFELSRREVGGDRLPYGLQLMLSALTPAVHGGDPVAPLDIDGELVRLRQSIQDPDYIKNLVRTALLDNPHRIRLVMRPDPALADTEVKAEQARLRQQLAAMSEADKTVVIEHTAALAERQAQTDDPELLPKVELADVPRKLVIPSGFNEPVGGMPASWFDQATNGLVYQQLVVELPKLAPDLVEQLPLYAACLTEVGCGEHDYLAMQQRQAAVTGGIHASIRVRSQADDLTQSRASLVLSGKALVRKHGQLSELLHRTFSEARFDELERLRELTAQIRGAAEMGITDHGHVLAMSAACAGLSPAAALSERWDGLTAVRQIKQLDDALNSPTALKALGEQLAEIHGHIMTAPRQFLVVSESQYQDDIIMPLAQCWLGTPAGNPGNLLTAEFANRQSAIAWQTNTQVNFCAKAYPAVPYSHQDAPPLGVLGGLLRNGYLHTAIREKGGAYGGGAGYDSDAGAFRFYSYRDPRLSETLEDFDRALEWLQQTNHPNRLVDEAILGVISGIDKPSSPAGEAQQAFHLARHGRTPEVRRAFRNRVLDTSMADLQRVANTYLDPVRASIGVVSNEQQLDRLQLKLDRQQV